MIEQFSRSELRQIMKELRESDIEISDYQKGSLMREEALQKGYKLYDFYQLFPSYSGRLEKAIYYIADVATNNFETINTTAYGEQERAKGHVSPEIADEYCNILSQIMDILLASRKEISNGR